MKTIKLLLILAFLTVFIIPAYRLCAQSVNLTAPADYFGFQPGSDRKLFSYDEMIAYLKLLDENSPLLQLEVIGSSPEGKKMYIAFISSSENIAALDELKVINKELALNSALSEEKRREYFEKGKVFVYATLSMHSTEVGPSQSAPLIAYDLLTTKDKKKVAWLKDVVFMMVPAHNPDGMERVVDNYKKHLGSKYEGASLPDVYHKYVGHDNNRDFVILSQEDTKAIAAVYNQTWFPQVMVEKHQMGSTGVRYFVPPNHDPIAENIPAGVFSWAGLFGQNMANDMTGAGLEGVAQHYLFDDYWPGSTETCIWKNVIGFLTEAASVRTASPVYVEANELSVGGKGLSEYKKSINMLLPWDGGWWRLGDIVEYEIVSTMSILKTAALYKEDILKFRNDICREMVSMGKNQAPYYYILPRKQHDAGELVNLVALLREHGIQLYSLNQDLVIEDIAFYSGDIVVPLAQAFRPFIKEVMEVQEFPERHYTPGGELIKPYDITSWSLPLHRNVKSIEINTKDVELESMLTPLEEDFSMAVKNWDDANRVILSVDNNESFRAAFLALEKGVPVSRLTTDVQVGDKNIEKGSFVVPLGGKTKQEAREIIESVRFPVIPIANKAGYMTEELELPRIALIETYFHDMDAGWTRYVFDSYHIPYTKVRPHELKDKDLEKKYDVIIFPDVDKNLLMEGKYKAGESYYQGNYHPDYTKGMGKEGKQALMEFINNGGLVISWGRSAGLFEGQQKIGKENQSEEFILPFKDISENLRKEGLYVPGSLLEITIVQDHPLTLGMPESTGVFSRGRPVFSTSLPGFDMDRRVIAVYPEKDILISGYAAKEEKIGNKSAMIWLKKGEGQLVLFGFNPQFRASTQSSYKLLFNSILLP